MKFLAELFESLTGNVRPERRLHADFGHTDGAGLYYNEKLHNSACPYVRERADKAHASVAESEAGRIDGCPFSATLRQDPRKPGYLELMVYAVPREARMAEVTAWLRDRRLSYQVLGHSGAGQAALQPG